MKIFSPFLFFLIFISVQNIIIAQCESGDLITKGEIYVCPDEIFDLESINVMSPQDGGFGWLFLRSSTGYGAFNTNFIMPNAGSSTKYDPSLSGVLPSLNLPNLYGLWTIKAASYSLLNSAFSTICDISEDSLVIDFSHSMFANITSVSEISLTANIFGGVSPFTYQWSNGDTTATTTNLMYGTMSVTITDAKGCQIIKNKDLISATSETAKSNTHFRMGPNPTFGNVIISLHLVEEEDISIDLFSIKGKNLESMIQESSRGGEYLLDLNEYQSGIYIIQIQVGSHRYIERLVID